VDQELTEGQRGTCPVHADEAQVGVPGEPFGERDLITPGRPRLVNDGLVGQSAIEVTIGLVVGLVELRYVLTSEPTAEPTRSTSAR